MDFLVATAPQGSMDRYQTAAKTQQRELVCTLYDVSFSPLLFFLRSPSRNLASLGGIAGFAGNLGTVDDLPSAVREHYDRYVSNGALLSDSLDGKQNDDY